MLRPILMAALAVVLMAPISLADSHTDKATGITIEFPEKWDIDKADAVVANAPDHLASMLVMSFKNIDAPADALQRLDIDDVMGNQIKNVRPDEKVLSKTIHGLPAKLFTGTVIIANTKTSFVAAVVPDKGSALVVFAFPANKAHLKQMIASIESMHGAKSEK